MVQSIIKQKGFSVVEILLAITVFAIFSVGLFYLSLDVLQRDAKIELHGQAVAYAQEGIEAMRNIRDRNYLLITNGDHGLQKVNGAWERIPAPENIDDFYYRTIVVSDVFRDDNGDIAETGTFDPDTKKIISTVEWNWRGVFPQSVSFTTYLSNWTGNDLIQIVCEDFEDGDFDETIMEETPAPPEDNCGIKLDIEEEESNFFASSNLGGHANDVVVDGNYAYVGGDRNHSGLIVVNVADKENPLIVKELNIGNRGRSLIKDGDFLYMGVRQKNAGLVIVNVSNPSNPVISSTLNIGDYGNRMDIKGDYLYMGADQSNNSLRIIDVSNKSNPSIAGSFNFSGVVSSVEIRGDYAFVGLENDRDSFRVLDISNPTSPSLVATLDLGEQVNDIEISGFYAYVGIEDRRSSLRVVEIANPTNPSVVASLDVGAEIEALKSYGNYLYAALDDQNAGMAVVNISNPSSPYLVYNYDISGKATGVDVDGTHVYVTTRTNNRGLVLTGTTIVAFNSYGEYISSPFDTGSVDTRYNYIAWDQDQIPGGSVKFQFRSASSSAGLNSANWVGPDGTNSTYYENSRTIIIPEDGAGTRYFQYKAILESDGVGTPLLDSVKINYTP